MHAVPQSSELFILGCSLAHPIRRCSSILMEAFLVRTRDFASLHENVKLEKAEIVPGSRSDSDRLWERLRTTPATDDPWRRVRWRFLRLGECPPELEADLGWRWLDESQRPSEDGRAVKFLLRSHRHRDACESVLLLPRPERGTVCISTQIGCGVGCTFCATGRMGLQRQLSSDEILEQVLRVRRWVWKLSRAQGRRIHLRNIVFMGMGEPLHNAQAVHEALEFLIADRGFGFSPRRITLSTAGVPEKMVEAARCFPNLRIALSLHAADRDLRRRLVPRATNDLNALRSAIAEINALDREGPVWIEYVLLGGVNDTQSHAQELVEFCKGLRVEINLIPFNDISHALMQPSELAPDRYRAPEEQDQKHFVRSLREAGFFTTLRNTLGQSIQAACGQLATQSQAI